MYDGVMHKAPKEGRLESLKALWYRGSKHDDTVSMTKEAALAMLPDARMLEKATGSEVLEEVALLHKSFRPQLEDKNQKYCEGYFAEVILRR